MLEGNPEESKIENQIEMSPEEREMIAGIEARVKNLTLKHADLIKSAERFAKIANFKHETVESLASALSVFIPICEFLAVGSYFLPHGVGSAGLMMAGLSPVMVGTNLGIRIGVDYLVGEDRSLERRMSRLQDANKLLDDMEHKYDEARAVMQNFLEKNGAGDTETTVIESEDPSRLGLRQTEFSVPSQEQEVLHSEMEQELAGRNGQESNNPDILKLRETVEQLIAKDPGDLSVAIENMMFARRQEASQYRTEGSDYNDGPRVGGIYADETITEALRDVYKVNKEEAEERVRKLGGDPNNSRTLLS